MKIAATTRWLVLLAFALACFGCERTPEDLEKWRNAQGGMEKMHEWATSSNEPTPVRVRAFQILIEEGVTAQIGPTLQEVEDEKTRSKLAEAGVEVVERLWKEGSLEKLGKTEGKEERLAVKKAIDAKDAAYFLIQHASGERKKRLQSIIDEWLSADWEMRSGLGKTDSGQLLPHASDKGLKAMLQWLEKTESPYKVASMLREHAGDATRKQIAEILKKKAEKAHPNLSDSLAGAVVSTKHEAIVPYLKKAITDPKTPRKFVDQAMEAIKEIQGERSTTFFSKLIREHTGALRWAAVNDLIKLRGKAGILTAASSLPLGKKEYIEVAKEGKNFKENAGWFASFAVGEMINSDVAGIGTILVRALESERRPVQVIGLTTTARAVTCATKPAECGEGAEGEQKTEDLLGDKRSAVLKAVENLTSSDEEIPAWGDEEKTVGELASDVAEAMKNSG